MLHQNGTHTHKAPVLVDPEFWIPLNLPIQKNTTIRQVSIPNTRIQMNLLTTLWTLFTPLPQKPEQWKLKPSNLGCE